jgi:DNA-binding XRE family transcriptional regulator
MQIKEFLFYNKLTQEEFAQLAGISRRTLVSIMKGKRGCLRSDVMRKIREASDNAISFEDMILEADGVTPSHPQLKSQSSQQIC